MHPLEGILLLASTPLVLLLTGYWIVAHLGQGELALRLSAGLLAGLASLLLTVSLVNFFLPLSGIAAWACLAPGVLTLAGRNSRALLAGDLRAFPRHRGFRGYSLIVVIFLGCLLWPLLSSHHTIFYEGTSNHDSFFWVGTAEHLQRHTYMAPLVLDPSRPLPEVAQAVIGWHPVWGRMGSEGFLALGSALTGQTPITLYLYLTAALFFPWLGAVWLVIRQFYSAELSPLASACVVALHPIFFFFHINSNLPNLLGALLGTLAVVATESALRAGRTAVTVAWSALLALSLHGLYCAYPEMIPFVFLPCGLLWLRAWFLRGPPVPGKTRWLVAAAGLVSLVLNPVTTWRAGVGFYTSFDYARTTNRWGNRLDPLEPAQYLPALGTLSPPAARFLGVWVSGLLGVLIVLGVALAWRRARDSVGALLAASGGIALLVYTVAADFVYGWQKSVQFTGVLVSAVMAGAIIDALARHPGWPFFPRRLVQAATAGLVAFLVFAVGIQCRELYRWSGRKALSQDWFTLRTLSRGSLRGQPVVVDPDSFAWPFYSSMWSAYFLADSALYFGARGDQGGGYLHDQSLHEGAVALPSNAIYLVSREWAGTLDADSPRIVVGREYALLRKSNRVYAMRGFSPATGVPDFASTTLEFEMVPHSASELTLELSRRDLHDQRPGNWRITRDAATADTFSTVVSGPPPWLIRIPMAAGHSNHLMLSFDGPASEPLPFVVGRLQINQRP